LNQQFAQLEEFIAPAAIKQYPGTIAILSAGTADLPVAERQLLQQNYRVSEFNASGMWVLLIHRLLSNRHVMAAANCRGRDGSLAQCGCRSS